jgi:hypothetical protein
MKGGAMKRKQIGSNLVEASIALAIFTILVGAIIQGPAIIDSAKVKKLAADFRNVPIYLNTYHSMYKAYPGDDPTIGTSNSHFTTATACSGTADVCKPGDGLIEGNWNDHDPTTPSEAYVLWQHLRLAGIVSGSTTLGAADYLPENGVGRNMGVQSGTNDTGKTPINATLNTDPIRGTFIICSEGILGKLAKQLDITMDDGNTATGMMMAGIPTAVGVPMTAVSPLNDSTIYTVCMGI